MTKPTWTVRFNPLWRDFFCVSVFAECAFHEGGILRWVPVSPQVLVWALNTLGVTLLVMIGWQALQRQRQEPERP